MSVHLREAWRKLADATNWRAFADSPIWREHDAVIMTQFRGRQRYYEVYTYGEDFGHYPRLDDAKAALERIYGPLQWQQITMPKVEVIHYYFGPTTEFTDPLTVYVASLPRLGKMARVTPEQQAFMDRVRSEQQAIFGDAMVCREVTQALHEKYGWPIEAGWYKGPGHDIRPTVGHFPGHWYHRLSDGTIIDPTHDQYQPGTPLQVIPPGDPRQEWYEKIRMVL